MSKKNWTSPEVVISEINNILKHTIPYGGTNHQAQNGNGWGWGPGGRPRPPES